MTGFYADDDDKIDYPTADRVVARYLRVQVGERPRTTSVDVLDWSDHPNTHHNRKRVYDALSAVCVATDQNWAGRTVFRLPDEAPDQ